MLNPTSVRSSLDDLTAQVRARLDPTTGGITPEDVARRIAEAKTVVAKGCALLETMDREVTDAYRAAATDQHPVSDAVKSAGAEHRTLRRKFGAETDAMIRRLRQAVARTAGSAPGGTP